MQFMLVKTGGRKFRCIDCDGGDPLRLPEVKKLLSGALRPPESSLACFREWHSEDNGEIVSRSEVRVL